MRKYCKYLNEKRCASIYENSRKCQYIAIEWRLGDYEGALKNLGVMAMFVILIVVMVSKVYTDGCCPKVYKQ